VLRRGNCVHWNESVNREPITVLLFLRDCLSVEFAELAAALVKRGRRPIKTRSLVRSFVCEQTVAQRTGSQSYKLKLQAAAAAPCTLRLYMLEEITLFRK
jgi:hypothetical protein